MEFMVQIVVSSNKHGRLNSNSKHYFNDFVRTMQMAKKKAQYKFYVDSIHCNNIRIDDQASH